MNKKFIFFILLPALFLTYTFSIDKSILKSIDQINNSFKSFWIDIFLDTQQMLDIYINQKNTIITLKQENKDLQYKNIHLKKIVNDTKPSQNNSTIDLLPVEVLSYVDFTDFTKVWIDHTQKTDTISGLIYDNNAVGITKKRGDKIIAYLNGNENCNYTVFIGKNKAPAIIHKIDNSKNLLAKYIPLWSDINIGENVITSGMDQIFFEGLDVGKVVKINKKTNSLEAIIEPNINVLNKSKFYLYTSNKKSIKNASK